MPGAPFFKPLPGDCRLELLRFLGFLPLARLDFRSDVHPQVTCSDASTSGGGVCVSHSLTKRGEMVALGHIRGDTIEERTHERVLSIGLFDGIGALRVALDLLNIPCIGHVSVEKAPQGSRVVEAAFPGSVQVPDVTLVDDQMVREWSLRFSQATLILLGAGPP